MRSIVSLNILVLAVLIAAPAAADEWNRSFPVTGPVSLRVDTNDGRVTVTPWDKAECAIHVTTGGWHIGSHFQVSAEQNGAEIVVNAHASPTFGILFGSYWAHIDVSIPRRADLDIRTGDGSVIAESIQGKIRIWTGDGRIVARNLIGDVHLHTGDGGIEASDLDGRLDASSGDGRITVRGRFDSLELESGDGHILAEATNGSALGDGWSLHTGDGGLTLRVPIGLKADLEAVTGDGSISVDMPVALEGVLRPSHHLRGTLNGGGPPLRLRSGDGPIRIEKL